MASIRWRVRSLTVDGGVRVEVVVELGVVRSGRMTVSGAAFEGTIGSGMEPTAHTFSFFWLWGRLAFGWHRFLFACDSGWSCWQVIVM